VKILMEGAYGSLAVNLEDNEKCKMVLMVSGGIGVTPMQSIATHLKEIKEESREIKKMKFVWSAKSVDIIDAMKNTAMSTNNTNGTSFLENKDPDVDVELYVTEKNAEGDEEIDKKAVTAYGRPNLHAIFNEMKKSAIDLEESTVAVLVCGPNSLLDDCREACRIWSDGACDKDGVKFVIHEEKFEL